MKKTLLASLTVVLASASFAQIKYVDDPELNVRITEPPPVQTSITKEELNPIG